MFTFSSMSGDDKTRREAERPEGTQKAESAQPTTRTKRTKNRKACFFLQEGRTDPQQEEEEEEEASGKQDKAESDQPHAIQRYIICFLIALTNSFS